MPRVHVSRPDAASIKANPRAFAILKQVQAKDGDSSVETTVLKEYLKKYGAAGAEAVEGSLSFEAFAALFKVPATPASPEGEGNAVGYAAMSATTPLVPIRFTRRETGPNDVRIQITHSGICHSDVHQATNGWGGSKYPMVPGHEIAGYVTEVGSAVTRFQVGDRAGVGCMVNSCQSCEACTTLKEEQFCAKLVYTYNGTEVDGVTPTHGGYSNFVLVNERFVLRVPDAVPLESAGPLMCAGITVYSPLRRFKLDIPGLRVGVVGLGGLGHMAVKIATAMGVHVTVLSTSASKKHEAVGVLGAKEFLLTSSPEAMKAAAGTLDGIINTVSAKMALDPLLALLKVDGKMVCVGVPEEPPLMPLMSMLFKRLSVAGSVIGGIAETQEMLDFCAEKGVTPMIEIIKADYINTAYERMQKNDVHYRFVIDVQGSIINE